MQIVFKKEIEPMKNSFVSRVWVVVVSVACVGVSPNHFYCIKCKC